MRSVDCVAVPYVLPVTLDLSKLIAKIRRVRRKADGILSSIILDEAVGGVWGEQNGQLSNERT